ncbi:BTB/POZ domain-containing protein At2g13690 [Euphorbia peplus]|nr:BTB/POZ domain-containing protein At2g13690 [Euphorbia peplus]
MADSGRRNPSSEGRKFRWCCSLNGHGHPPPSPENPVVIIHKKSESLVKIISNSPLTSKSIARRILSPGRVSPMESDPIPIPIQETATPVSKSRSESLIFDVRLNLRGKKGGGLVLETSSEVLFANSEIFAGLILEYRKGLGLGLGLPSSSSSLKVCRIEVPDVDNLGAFRDTIDLMFEPHTHISKTLVKLGVYRSILILEVSASIMFNKGVSSCLKYLEAVPWTEEEEEKLRVIFSVFQFDDSATQDILARLYLRNLSASQQNLSRQLVWSITTSTDNSARNELKSLVKGLLCQSSVYEKEQPELNKEDLYVVCQSCVSCLVSLLEEASGTSTKTTKEGDGKRETGKPLVERISRQVDNINWLLEILIDRQMCEEFVDMWADQGELIETHESASPMVRYEVSRVSATLIIAMGTRKLHCRAEARAGLLQAWFHPMLSDFGWLQRCKKGLDIKALEDALGQTLLTLPLKQQYALFMEWFRCFSKCGSECPNLSKAFQIWWRRSFLRGSETHAIESR